MKKDEVIEIVNAVEIEKGITKKIKTTGVRKLDYTKANELGVFKRISNLLCVVHTTIITAYRIYGEVDYLFDELRARKNEINREMNLFDKEFARFMRFWTDYYVSDADAEKEIMVETERLYHQIMRWMQIPETWQLGDEQRTKDDVDVAIRIESPQNEKTYTFHKVDINQETLESKESWCVLCYDVHKSAQETVNVGLDKATATMIAKRLSDNDKENIYTVAMVRDLVEKRSEITPYKAFRDNKTIGKITKFLKK